MRLYSKTGQRLYLNESERQAFTIAASVFDLETEALCLFLLHTGCRLSEALNVIASDIQSAEAIIAIRSLKKRDQHHVREIPLPPEFAEQLNTLTMTKPDEIVWAMSRTTAWRKVTRVMSQAGIVGLHATPKGLRHSFAVHCAFSNIPMPLTQKWMGHADIQTTAIYYQIIGDEEREMAKRMWN